MGIWGCEGLLSIYATCSAWLPDCMFADDAAQSIIAFLTVVCRHTGGRYIAPEVSMHNTRATHKCSSKCAQLFAVCTLSFCTTQEKYELKITSMKSHKTCGRYNCARGVNAQHKHALISTCTDDFVCFNNNVNKSMFIELTFSYTAMGKTRNMKWYNKVSIHKTRQHPHTSAQQP